VICKNHPGIRLEDIDNMTMSEIQFYLDNEGNSHEGAIDLRGISDEEYLKWWASLPPEEKLDMAIRGEI
jgi:cobalamin biosynthesis Mg chelatase CobN